MGGPLLPVVPGGRMVGWEAGHHVPAQVDASRRRDGKGGSERSAAGGRASGCQLGPCSARSRPSRHGRSVAAVLGVSGLTLYALLWLAISQSGPPQYGEIQVARRNGAGSRGGTCV